MRYLLVFCVLALNGCDREKAALLEKENKELREQLDQRKRLVDLDTQGKCSAAATDFFKERWGTPQSDTLLLDFSNHYDSSLGKCFVMVEWHRSAASKDGAWFNLVELHDVFEKNKYAELSEHHGLTRDGK